MIETVEACSQQLKRELGLGDLVGELQRLARAGTELPLILRDATASDIPLFGTTVIHARAIVAAAMR